MHFARSNNLQRETSLHTTSSPLLFFKRKEQIEDDAFACSVFFYEFCMSCYYVILCIF